MHTLLIHQGFAGPTDSGGTRHFELAQHALERGQRFSVVASDFGYISGQRHAGSAAGRREDVQGVGVYRVATLKSLHGGLLGQLFSFLSFAITSLIAGLRVRDIDIVMATTPPIFQAATAWLIAAIRRRPLLLEVRDLWPEFLVDMGKIRNPVAIALARRLERFLYSHADQILVNSPAYVGYLREKGVPDERITLIPNGVSPEMFESTPESAAAAAEIRRTFDLKGKFVVTYAGVMGPANDLGVLLDAAALFRDDPSIHVMLVGNGKTRDALEAQAKSLGLTNVTFAGPQPKAKVPHFLEASDACVATLQNIAMFRMTYPNKVFDYLAAARPVVLAIDGVIREVVEAAGAGVFVQPGDPRALADAIRALAADPAAGRAMGEAGRNYVITHFNRARHGAAFADLLSHTAGNV